MNVAIDNELDDSIDFPLFLWNGEKSNKGKEERIDYSFALRLCDIFWIQSSLSWKILAWVWIHFAFILISWVNKLWSLTTFWLKFLQSDNIF